VREPLLKLFQFVPGEDIIWPDVESPRHDRIILASSAILRPSEFYIRIAVARCAFVLELMNGEKFVTQWSAIPAQITSGHHWITILTAMFMHGSWSHIIGNMIFLWAFAPEIEDTMGRDGI